MITSQRGASLTAAIAAISLVGVGLSVTIPLLSLRMKAAGYDAGIIGMQTALGGAATLLLSPFVPWLAMRLGMRALMLLAVMLAALCLLGFDLTTNITFWWPLRLLIGCALTSLFVASEFWINAAAPPDQRGLVMGLYTTVLAAGFALGPALLLVTGTQGDAPFIAAMVIFLAASVPLWLYGDRAPVPEPASTGDYWSVVRAVPAAVFATLAFGMVETASIALLPVYALARHESAQTGALDVSLYATGILLLQIPIGLLSDRFDRRHILLMTCVTCALAAWLMPTLANHRLAFAALLIGWGGVVSALYPVALALLGTTVAPEHQAPANAVIVMFYATGMMAGPPVMGKAMDLLGPGGLFYGMAGVLALCAALLLALKPGRS